MGKQQGEFQESDKSSSEKIDSQFKGDNMKSSIRDQAEGAFHEAKGKVKQAAGKLTDNPKLRVEGAVEKMAGKAQEKLGQVKRVFGK